MSEVFSYSFVLTIAITMVLIGAVAFILYNKMQQQSMKISAVMDLVTSVVKEVEVLKGVGVDKMFSQDYDQEYSESDTKIIDSLGGVSDEQMDQTGMIEVSDDDYEDVEEDEDEEDDEEEEEEDDEDDEEEEEEDDEEDDNSLLKGIDLKTLNFEATVETLDEPELSKTVNIEDELLMNKDEISNISVDDDSKLINISEGNTTIDYTKLSAGELRKMAVDRELLGKEEKAPKKSKLIEMLSSD